MAKEEKIIYVNDSIEFVTSKLFKRGSKKAELNY